MKNKFLKLKKLIKEHGVIFTVKKMCKYIKNKIKKLVKKEKIIENESKIKELENEFNEALNNTLKNVDRVIVWRSSFGWNVPLYQRPQHIANCLSKKNTMVLYEVTIQSDNIETIKKQQENLFLINFSNPNVNKYIYNYLNNVGIPKYIQIYSTNWSMPASDLEDYINKGFKIIYEYIDDINPVLAGTEELPVNIKEKYEYVMNHIDNIYVVATAQKIIDDVISKRGEKNLTLACNGVDYEFFRNLDSDFKYEEEFNKIIEEDKPIIGYYGALASWFDYELIKKLADERKNYNIVFFGIKYDDSYDKSDLSKYSNIHFLGSRNYLVLKNYATKFTVCTIPFLINSITEATSPVKLFEYMALGKPIVTTDMHECRKYKSVIIAKNHEEYIDSIDKAVQIYQKKEENKQYFELLNKEAIENDWNKKAEAIIELIKQGE